MHQQEIDRQIFDLYDEYCHGDIDRREFFKRAGAITIAGASALAMAQALLPCYAEAQTISFTDKRIKALYVNYPSPGGRRTARRRVGRYASHRRRRQDPRPDANPTRGGRRTRQRHVAGL